jgi:hypothetical protein
LIELTDPGLCHLQPSRHSTDLGESLMGAWLDRRFFLALDSSGSGSNQSEFLTLASFWCDECWDYSMGGVKLQLGGQRSQALVYTLDSARKFCTFPILSSARSFEGRSLLSGAKGPHDTRFLQPPSTNTDKGQRLGHWDRILRRRYHFLDCDYRGIQSTVLGG